MRKILLGVFSTVILVFFLQYCEYRRNDREQLKTNSALIHQQLQNVGKLIVSEGTYAEVFAYEDSKKLYFDVFSASKKALIVVNATASIAYDLSKIETTVDVENKTVTIISIPAPALSINPKIEYYDLQQDFLNQFNAEDHNKIKERVEGALRDKIEGSDLTKNAQNRLISELQKIYILTNSMGWALQYKGKMVETENDFAIPFKD